MSDPTYLSVQSRGTVALPADLRRRHHLDRPGTQLEVRERPDGVIELRPVVPVPADQAWFWSPEWQAGERRVDDYVSRSEVRVSNSADDFLSELDAVRTRSRRRR
jgi:bifunctional DNA-binding transcriptional regulator/antitoxin component of YhaV-PrlF toxin-antitoxin module